MAAVEFSIGANAACDLPVTCSLDLNNTEKDTDLLLLFFYSIVVVINSSIILSFTATLFLVGCYVPL